MLFQIGHVTIDFRHLFLVGIRQLFMAQFPDVFGKEIEPASDLEAEAMDRCYAHEHRRPTCCFLNVFLMPNERQP